LASLPPETDVDVDVEAKDRGLNPAGRIIVGSNFGIENFDSINYDNIDYAFCYNGR
jgi:hypothetical protein